MSSLLFGAWLLPINRALAKPNPKLLYEETLRIFVDALLPADELTPAASELNVHIQIMNDAIQNPGLESLIVEGCQWLKQSLGSLSALDSEQIERLLFAMSKADWDTGPRNFYHEIRDRAVMYYYADPRAWVGSAINRPPQPLGYPEVIIS